MRTREKDSHRRIRLRIETSADEYLVIDLSPSNCKNLATDLLMLAHKRAFALERPFIEGLITMTEPRILEQTDREDGYYAE